MKRTGIICLLISLCCAGAHAWTGDVKARDINPGSIPVLTRPGLLGDSGLKPADIATTGQVAQVEADLAGKHPLEDQRLSTTNDAVFVSVSGSGAGLTDLNYSNVTNPPTLFTPTDLETDYATDWEGLTNSIAGKVDVNSGTATNLTVADTLTVEAVIGQTTATISGSEAGDFAGEYFYAGTDEYYGQYFTNSLGKVLFQDEDWEFSGDWSLGNTLGVIVFSKTGSIWENSNYDQVDVVMSGTPFYGLVKGDAVIEGKLKTPLLNTEEIIVSGGDGILSYDTTLGVDLYAYPSYPADSIYVRSVQSVVNAKSINNGSINIGHPAATGFTDRSVYFSDISVYTAGGSVNIATNGSNCNSLFGVFSAVQGSSLMLESASSIAGSFYATENDIIIKNCTSVFGALGTEDGPSVLHSADNVLVVGDNITISNKNNVAIIGTGITAFTSDASYAGSFVAGYGNGTSTTNNRYYFGSNSWIFVSGTNLMFRNSAGNIGTVNVTY